MWDELFTGWGWGVRREEVLPIRACQLCESWEDKIDARPSAACEDVDEYPWKGYFETVIAVAYLVVAWLLPSWKKIPAVGAWPFHQESYSCGSLQHTIHF